MKTETSQLKEIIYEELLDERNSIIIKEEFQRINLLHERMENDLLPLNEGWGWKDIAHVGLDIVGLIPYVGAPADLTNALWYFWDEEWLMGALSIIAVVPVVGDIIGVGGKFLVKGGAKATKATAWMGRKLAAHMPQITKTFEGLAKSNAKLAPYMGKALDAVKGFARRMVMAPSAADSIALAARASKAKSTKLMPLDKVRKLAGEFPKSSKAADLSPYLPSYAKGAAKFTPGGKLAGAGKITRKGKPGPGGLYKATAPLGRSKYVHAPGGFAPLRSTDAAKYTLGLPAAFTRASGRKAMGLSRLGARTLDRVLTRMAVATTGHAVGGAVDLTTGGGYDVPYSMGFAVTRDEQEILQRNLTSLMNNINEPGAKQVAQKIWDIKGFDRDGWCAANEEFDCG
tara:strand:- start:12314 stop:13513 length:1200 start_codon:yes stop_codon:yes gene_type:complete